MPAPSLHEMLARLIAMPSVSSVNPRFDQVCPLTVRPRSRSHDMDALVGHSPALPGSRAEGHFDAWRPPAYALAYAFLSGFSHARRTSRPSIPQWS